MTCLHLAAQAGKVDVVKFLVGTRCIDVNIIVSSLPLLCLEAL